MLREIDENYMRLALSLAERRKGYTHPNPTVGAVVVKNGRVVGLGYHEKAGKEHAEVVALRRAGRESAGSTLYVTLEPCTHFGKTPPCTDAILRSGVRRVVVATRDPNPLVGGKGIERLKKAGLEVVEGVCEEEALRLNEDFFVYITEKRPFVTLKWAQTIDGKLATRSGKSKWITSYESRKYAHRLRLEATAVLVGVNTVIEDDPLLTVRHIPAQKQPVRIILDPGLRTPLGARILNTREAPTWIVTKKKGSETKPYKEKGVRIITVEDFNLKNILSVLHSCGIVHLLVEGGPRTLSSFLKEKLFDRLLVFIAPKVMGEGLTLGGLAPLGVEETLNLKRKRLIFLGKDCLAEFVPLV